jgi:aminoglycoside phosphotransferase (APT) family kinase protein
MDPTGGEPIGTSEAEIAGIDRRAVTAWFAGHLDGVEPPLGFARVVGGHSNLTFVVTDANGRRFVLRRPPLGGVLATAHDVAREHRIMSALSDTGVPVPTMLGVSADDSVNGAPFFVMSYVEGVVLHDAEVVADHLPDAASRYRAGMSMVDALVTLHGIDPGRVGLEGLSRPTGYLERQLRRWSAQWSASKTRELPGMERLHTWLVANRPPDPAARIVHGDFRLGNALLGPDGSVRAVVDWELCSLGDPLADVSYLLRSWVGPGEPVPGSIVPPTTVAGFPAREAIIDRYARGSGRDLGELSYWMAFNAWRSAAIGQGVYRRYLDGSMGERPEDLDRYAQGVEASCAAGLVAAGLEPAP